MSNIKNIYKNITKGCWSISEHGKRVVHADEIVAGDARFYVNQNGRKRVIESGVKNVHAFIKTRDLRTNTMGFNIRPPFMTLPHRRVDYNPFKCEQFHAEGCLLYWAYSVYLNKDGEVYAFIRKQEPML